ASAGAAAEPEPLEPTTTRLQRTSSPGTIRLRTCRRRDGLQEIWEAEWADGRSCVAHVHFHEAAPEAEGPPPGRDVRLEPPAWKDEKAKARSAFDPTQTAPALPLAAAPPPNAPSGA